MPAPSAGSPTLTARARELLAAAERAVAGTGAERDRRDRPHEPRPGAAVRRGPRRRRTRGRGYSNLELELDTGARGSRHAHVERLLVELTGAEAAIAVNNGAAAVLLAVAALAGPGDPIVVSRGQLVEIGGGFRIPDVIAVSGATMIEVGTTNRTRLGDYERALERRRTAVRRRSCASTRRTSAPSGSSRTSRSRRCAGSVRR